MERPVIWGIANAYPSTNPVPVEVINQAFDPDWGLRQSQGKYLQRNLG
jgi:hypothetical protein